jgi:hypothetical protein
VAAVVRGEARDPNACAERADPLSDGASAHPTFQVRSVMPLAAVDQELFPLLRGPLLL